MSLLFTFQVHRQQASLRVDAVILFAMAEQLHSCARVSTQSCDSSAAADLVWREDLEGKFAVELFGSHWEGGLDADTVYFQSENLITQIFSERHGDKLQIHAGAVVSPGGRGCLIAGESGSGKTSLTLALMLEGWKWLSDELILIEQATPDEMVGVPRNFNIKKFSFAHFPETSGLAGGLEIFSPGRQCLVRFIDPGVLVPGSFVCQAPLELILFPKFTPQLCAPELHACSGTELSGRLVSSINCSPAWAMDWIIGRVGKTPAWELRYGSPRPAARFLQGSPVMEGQVACGTLMA